MLGSLLGMILKLTRVSAVSMSLADNIQASSQMKLKTLILHQNLRAGLILIAPFLFLQDQSGAWRMVT
jgi:hypothetical protein